ncbi:MAG TPA: alpha/beta fold hydrolase [Gemmatimonadaceae bacterium]|nr:alpha/beta fold hydrolase [Gemmatimonadaceae bacterium]
MMSRSIALLLLSATPLVAQTNLPRALYTDPVRDTVNPARMEVLHIPSGGVNINGVAYTAAGAGRHPTFVFFHGLPGNEKNLDLAQAVRRAGWNAVTLNYRGSWGSPGAFRFANNLQDADAALAYLVDTANARKLGVDTKRIVIAGHSMGGWVTALTAAHHPDLLGAILISTADMSRLSGMQREQLVPFMADNLESLAGTSAEQMADEILGAPKDWSFETAAANLAKTRLLVLTSDDGLAPHSAALVHRLRALGNTRVTTRHVATDHSWSDRRIRLESEVLVWLRGLR